LQAGHGTTGPARHEELALLQHRSSSRSLRRAPGDPTAVEALLRYDTSVQISQRVADVPLAVGDLRSRPARSACFFNGAANRDPAAFHEPDRLDVRRSPNPHLSFAWPPHLPRSQARLELRAALDTLMRRLPELRLDEAAPFGWRGSLFLRGLETLPVRF
jgi:cytochrome P450